LKLPKSSLLFWVTGSFIHHRSWLHSCSSRFVTQVGASKCHSPNLHVLEPCLAKSSLVHPIFHISQLNPVTTAIWIKITHVNTVIASYTDTHTKQCYYGGMPCCATIIAPFARSFCRALWLMSMWFKSNSKSELKKLFFKNYGGVWRSRQSYFESSTPNNSNSTS
jgi:hypothetical protein